MTWISTLRHRTWPELRQTWPFLLFFVGPSLAFLLALFAGYLLNRGAADKVRYFGTWLQLFGIALVAQGVRELRRDFNRPTVRAAIRARITAIVASLSLQHHTIAVGNATVQLTGVVATGHVGSVSSSVEERLERLAREIAAVRKEANERQSKMDSTVAELRGELAKERQERAASDASVTQRLENVAVGGLHLDVIGLWWLLAATIATSVPDGVAWVLHRLWT